MLYFIGLGSNLDISRVGSSKNVLEAAVRRICGEIGTVVKKSQWFESEPIPVSDQPWFVNGVVAVESDLESQELLKRTLKIEAEFGRVRSVANAARTLDLDVIAAEDLVCNVVANEEGPAITLPHPRMHERAFVLLPLIQIAPDWFHPVLKKPIAALVTALPPQNIRIMMDDSPKGDINLAN